MGSISEIFPSNRLRSHHGYTSSADSSSTSGEWGSIARSAQSSPGFPVTLKAGPVTQIRSVFIGVPARLACCTCCLEAKLVCCAQSKAPLRDRCP